MKIDHLAIWVDDLEGMRMFYTTYFGATAGDRYHNPTKRFTSYFLSFGSHAARLELMHRPDVVDSSPSRGLVKGITHVAFSVGSKEAVDSLTNRLRAEGYTIFSEARTTGDGYYESVVLDPEGNHLELTV
jgi:lactoylglutathione lyase